MNIKYRGNKTIAITRLKQDYSPKIAEDMPSLLKTIQDEGALFGTDYKVVTIYKGVNMGAFRVIERAVEFLRNGKQVNLEHLLE